ncbi:MAG: anion permease [Clostridiaceae bacterium]
MLSSAMIYLAVIVVLALAFDLINGFHDCANAIATTVSTRVMTLQQAILMSAAFNFIGAFMSTAVAKTIGNGLVNPVHINSEVIIAALVGAIAWNLITWYLAIPSSSSHALIGGLIGAAITFSGTIVIVDWLNFFWKVALWIFLSPLIGFVIGYFMMTLLNWVLRKTRPKIVTAIFSKLQIVSAMLMALNHGSNDAQKSMGIIAMALVSGGMISQFTIPLWVKISCALAMAIGTGIGGKKIIKTMGTNMAKLAPVNGFAAETSAAGIIFTATMLHAPVSTTHIISTAIMGVAASKRITAVKWVLAKDIVTAWILTIPASALLSALIMLAFKLI